MATPESMLDGVTTFLRELPLVQKRAWRGFSMGVSLSFALGCGGPRLLAKSFDTNWQRKAGEEGKSLTANPALVAGISGRELVARTLPNGKVWRSRFEPNVLPSISNGTIAFTTPGEVIVLEGMEGRELVHMPSSGRRLEGYSFDGNYAIFLLVDEDDARPDLIRITTRSGKTVAEAQSFDRVGSPLAQDGVGLVPWASQYVSGFKLSTGEYLGRIVARSAPNRVQANEAGIFLSGGGGIVPFSSKLAEDPALKALRMDPRELPGEPFWPEDGSKPRLARATPISVLAEPTLSETGEAKFAWGRTAVSYFELVAALDPATLDPIWVNHFPHTAIGQDSNTSGALYCLEDGSLELLDWETGTRTPVATLAVPLKACAVDSGDLKAPSGPRPNLEEQIAFQEFLVGRLALRSTRAGTSALLRIARDPLSPSPLVRRAQKELGQATEGLDVLLLALNEAAAALSTTAESKLVANVERPIPLAALARALTRAGEKGAALPLARHLPLPGLAGEDALAIAEALLVLGDDAEVRYAQDFLLANKNVATTEQFALAIENVIRFLIRRGGAVAKQTRAAIEEEMTQPNLKSRWLEAISAEEKASSSPLAPGK
jgi:hypothetical protein